MRGKDRHRVAVAYGNRITPAYAGKRAGACARGASTRDHPRVCGEKCWPLVWMIWLMGSPPRMRGRVKVTVCQRFRAGITPAYAGKRSVKDLGAGGLWDHPRVCGEEVACECGNGYPLGSPPRMRGRVPNTCVTTTCCGITPAYAGKRSVKDLGAGGLWDHPRVCGEKLNKAIKLKHAGGSPPRMRGRVMRCSICQRGSGITPAYAGKRLPLSLSLIPCRDHPRVCGEEGGCCLR